MCNARFRRSSLSLAIMAVCAGQTQADTFNWTGVTDGDFATGTNWQGGTAPADLTNATLVFNATTVGAGEKTIDNAIGGAPTYYALQFLGGDFTLGGNAIALRPYATPGPFYFTQVLYSSSGNNTISAPLQINPNSANWILSEEGLDWASIGVGGGSLTLDGTLSASLMHLTANVSTGASLNLSSVSAKSFTANGGNLNLEGLLDSDGDVTISGSQFSVNGASGAIKVADVAANVTLASSGTKLTLDNSIDAYSDRLAGNVVMEAGSTLSLKGHATTAVAETAGGLKINGSNAQLTNVRVEGAGANASLTFSSLTRSGLVNFAATGALGGAERIKFSTAPTLTDGLMSGALVNGQEFATYDTTQGVKSATSATALAGATATDNVFVTASENVTGNATVNSLAVKDAEITSSGANTLSLASGRLLTTGTTSIAPAIDFGAKAGQIINFGTAVLAGGVNGSNGLSVLGNGSLELQSAGTLTGSFSHTGQLILSANDALQGANVTTSGMDIGTTTQHFNSLSGSNVVGTGTVVAATSIALTQGLIDTSLQANSVNVMYSGGTINGNIQAAQTVTVWNNSYGGLGGTINGDVQAQTVSLEGSIINGNIDAQSVIVTNDLWYSTGAINGNIQASQLASLSNFTVNGVISGAAYVSSAGTFTNQNTYTGSTSGSLTLSGNGSIAASSGFFGNLTMLASDGGDGELNRIGDGAAVDISGHIALHGQGNSIVVSEDIGAMTVYGTSSMSLSNSTNGSTTLRADSLQLASGASLELALGSNSGFYVDTGPGLYTDTNIVKDVYVTKVVNGGYLPSWADYDAGTGRIAEALVAEKSLNTASANEFVRITDATNQPLNVNWTVGGVNVDTNQNMNGSGTLTVGSGQLLFWKDNTVDIAGLNFGAQQGVVINAGTNTIASQISGTNGLRKVGSGTLVLTAQNNYTGLTQVSAGKLKVDGGRVLGTVAVESGASLELLNGGVATISHNSGDVDLRNAYTNASTSVISGYGVINAHAGLNNYGVIDGTVNNAGVSTITNTGQLGGVNISGGGALGNSGNIGGVDISGVGALSNTGSISSLYYSSSNAFTNHGQVGYLSNSGSVTNAGTVSSLDNYGTVINNTGRTIANVWNNGTFTNNGTVEGLTNWDGRQFTNNGTLRLDYASLDGTVTNNDTATLSAGAYASGFGYVQNAGTTTIDGEFTGDMQIDGGILKGSGRIYGNLTLNGGSINPGNSPGLFTVEGDVLLGVGSTLNLEVTSLGGQWAYDQLVVTGTFTKQGDIKLSLAGGVSFTGDKFNLGGQSLGLEDIFSYDLLSSLVGQDIEIGGQLVTVTEDFVPEGKTSGAPAVPIPGAVWLMGSGLLGLLGVARRKSTTA